jgi:predicted nucleotide-binding protein
MNVHGRSLHRDDLKRELEQQGIRVVVLTDEFEPTMPIPEKFERYAASVDGAIVLVTPDDVGGLADGSDRATRRARENVWVEAGWFWGRRGRGKMMLLRQRKATDEDAAGMPSDLGSRRSRPSSTGCAPRATRPKAGACGARCAARTWRA